jgi:hypothetical protein
MQPNPALAQQQAFAVLQNYSAAFDTIHGRNLSQAVARSIALRNFTPP